MDQERFEKLKQRAAKVLDDLTPITGDTVIIHERDRLCGCITNRILLLEKRGVFIYEDRLISVHNTLDKLKECLDDANTLIVRETNGPKQV